MKTAKSYPNELQELLHYEPESGLFFWKVDRRSVGVGQVAGCMSTRGYIGIAIKGKYYFAHRLACSFVYGNIDGKLVDHINRNRADNRIANLRVVTDSENQQNLSFENTKNSSGLRGAVLHKQTGKWQAQIVINKKYKYLGLYETAKLAHEAYRVAKAKVHSMTPVELATYAETVI